MSRSEPYTAFDTPIGHISTESPVRFTDRRDRLIRLRTIEGTPPDVDALVGMYADFGATDRAQGIPPIGTDRIREWLTGLTGIHVVAEHGGDPVGHAVLVPIDGGTGEDEDGETNDADADAGTGADAVELAIFVHPDYQGARIGTETLGVLLDHGADSDADEVQLHVERSNDAAVALYRKYGFTAVDTRAIEFRMRRSLKTAPTG
ncbi:GNAT family N-acetyltransferase [Halopenitus sp. POP-27]|uniref:GNAT family N-acetyltransferase n=1 Tax=Halopenitus sp. POP-27 TaxID=2994425 RepID=UPI0024688019|nr:GNAT family N-acetyltransferase [Halopenitus sp. POP-27]